MESRFACLKQVRFWIVFRKAMSWTWYLAKHLRKRVEEIDDLRDEKQQECFTKMSKDSHDGKCHPSEIAKCIANKNFRWKPEKKCIVTSMVSETKCTTKIKFDL